ncbi:MAG: hypothetical protein HPY46_05505 [Candidatus Aminicenantes bacterium]|uniref:Uncharacterized protein n=1 Tax=Candidatus Saccharicenans subterraneus TaxID=2508984 RepID=A0A3E2BJ23_9BACT|nr:hypothetical protein [Candidatus Aminicenantes bacterium]RFT14662.1 MAG: hypothetical protein OP8BY_2488 [Candidatus Saccharicenans subterraneum]
MKSKISFLLVIIMVATAFLAGQTQKLTFQGAREQATKLHRSLLPSATPAVQARIKATARAARTYLETCGQSCDLHAFLNKDIRQRFSTRKETELQLLETLAFAEIISGMSEQDQLDLQNRLQKEQQLLQTISNIMKNEHDTLKAIIQNIRS